MNYDDFLQLTSSRRSTRIFQSKPVPEAVIQRIVTAAIQAPTSCNRQLWEFVVITDPEVKDRVSRLGDFYGQSYLYDAPVIIAVFYDDTMESRNPCYTPFITTGMAIYGLLLAAETEQLGAIYLGGISNPQGVAKAVNAPRHLRNLGLVCLGYKDDNPPTPPRRSADDVIHYNTLAGVAPRCYPDIRPHRWNLEQLADFREKVLWYKGTAFDAAVLHANPVPRLSRQIQYFTGKVCMAASRYRDCTVLDCLPHNGDTSIQLLLSGSRTFRTLYAYEIHDGILQFIQKRLADFGTGFPIQYLTNADTKKLAIPLPDQSVDVLACYERLAMFDDPTLLLQEIHRVLKSEGMALIMASNRLYPHFYRYKRTRKKNYALGRNWNYGPEKKFSEASVEGYLRRARLKAVSVSGIHTLQFRLLTQLGGVLRKFNFFGLADKMEDFAAQFYCSHGWTARFAQSILYEVKRGE